MTLEKPQMDTTNPLLAKIKLPGKTFQLPSRGALYKNGEIDASEGEIHVHALSALAEIDLKNPDTLFNGKAIERVFAECIPQIKKATELYGRDIDAIMYFLRLVTYGPNFDIQVTHDCEESNKTLTLPDGTEKVKHTEHGYSVNIEQLVMNMPMLDPTTIEEEYTCALPNGQVVKVEPVKFAHMIKLFHLNAGKKKFETEDIKENVVVTLTSLIKSVDGIEDKKQIREWVSGITTPWQNRITETIEKTNTWGPSQTVTLCCKDCKKDMKVDLPVNPISFFTE